MIGNGNVAIDVARMLVLTAEELAPTDTADHALEVLAASRVKRSSWSAAAGRRRPRSRTPSCWSSASSPTPMSIVDAEELERGAGRPRRGRRAGRDRAAQRRDPARVRRRASRRAGQARRAAVPASPVALLAGERRPSRRRRAGPQRARRRAPTARCARRRPTSARRCRAGLVFRAIGYRGIPLPGVPFDERSGVIPNEGGRVRDPESASRSPASTSSAGSSAAPRA